MHPRNELESSGWCARSLALLAALTAACSGNAAADQSAERSGDSRASASAPRIAPAPSTPLLTSAAADRPAKKPAPVRYMLPCPAKVPEALDPPANVTLELALPASGVQVYACSAAKPGDGPAWTLEGPHAVLEARRSEVAAIHFAGPTWQALDGSAVKGAKLAAADAPKESAIAWLLLSASASGSGAFGSITHVQRLDTEGGKPPREGCDAQHVGARVLVPYRSSYFFYRAAAAGESVHQCRSSAGAGKHER